MINMSELISGKEARLAWANGQDVEFRILDSINHKNWKNIYDASYGFNIHDFDSDEIDFRLKPETVKIMIEVPAPFEPKLGEKYWIIETSDKNSYSYISSFENDEQDKSLTKLGAWRTEDEIKQVVAELRKLKG